MKGLGRKLLVVNSLIVGSLIVDWMFLLRGVRGRGTSFKLQASGCRFSAEGGPAFGGEPVTCNMKRET